ncbi:MAG: type IV secretory system conjugative DNA transfer family protein, partial [Lachnospiraceae bacterium]|nr:type IV secretory system conjugative DNA transfer family protein [Lachnospiraceae bacterium]
NVGLVIGEDKKDENVLAKIKKIRNAPERYDSENEPLNCYVDSGDVHMLLIGASGIGKTANFLYPNIEYAFASGMSFLTTDTKGDLYKNTATIGKRYYGYKIKVIDLRNPMKSSGYNMIYLINKYMDLYKKTGELKYQSKAEKYAKITSKTIIEMGVDPGSFGQNSYFYDSAEGVVTAALLIIATYGKPGERHIVSVFKLIQDLMEPSGKEGMNRFQVLVSILPQDSRARWYAASGLKTSSETMMSVMSTAMSRLLSFLDAELEQMMCFKNSVDVEQFCKEKTAIYVTLPEEDTTKHFMASLFIQQMYREMLEVADSNGGHLDNRVMFYCDELGTMPKIDGLEAMFSAARSRRISIIAIIQSLSQFEKTYGKEGAEIIEDNCQLTLFGGFAPQSKTAEVLAQNLGKMTVESASVNYNTVGGLMETASGKTLSMAERALMTVDELKNMPKGHFILMKTGVHPFRTTLRLFLKWGITFEEEYALKSKEQKRPKYIEEKALTDAIIDAKFDAGEFSQNA